jgi:hypothetical protein
MFFRSSPVLGKILVLLGLTLGLAACGSSSSNTTPVGSTTTTTTPPTTYSFTGTVLGSPNAASFDIGFVDETLHQYFLANKTTNGVDVVNTLTSAYLGTSGAGAFQGPGFATTPATAGYPGNRAPNGGPNGVVSIGHGLVAAGDGNSTLKIVSAAPNISSSVVSITINNPYTSPNLQPGICQGTANGATGQPSTIANNYRVDELAYDPTDNIIIALSDLSCPAFVTFVQGTAPYAILGQVPLLTANGGAEQPVWDPTLHLFLANIPSTVQNPGGEIDTFSPSNLNKINSVITFPLPCGGSGLALGQNETYSVACGGSALAGGVLSPTSPGHIMTITTNGLTSTLVNDIVGPSPDEIWYSPASNRFYGASSGPPGELTVTDGSGNLIVNVPTATGSHSVAVEGVNDHVFIPENATGGNNAIDIFNH